MLREGSNVREDHVSLDDINTGSGCKLTIFLRSHANSEDAGEVFVDFCSFGDRRVLYVIRCLSDVCGWGYKIGMLV